MLPRYVRKSVSSDGLKIFWVTDSHILDSVDGEPDSPGATGGSLHFYTASAKLRNFVSLVNDLKPDLAVHTGDIIQNMNNMNTFKNTWDTIDSSVRKEVTLGNHDVPRMSYSGIVNALGYQEREEIAHSKFNQAFTLSKGHVSARIIICDTTVDENGNHVNATGQLQADAREWIENELNTTSEKCVLLFMHHGPHDFDMRTSGGFRFFDDSHAFALKEIVDQAVTTRGIKVHCLFGHRHPQAFTEKTTTLGAYFPGYAGATMVDNIIGKMNIVNVLPDGNIELQVESLRYPFI